MKFRVHEPLGWSGWGGAVGCEGKIAEYLQGKKETYLLYIA